MTTKTRAAIMAKFGEPLLVDEIELADPGDEEVLVKLFATGICHSQLHQIHNPDGPVPTLLGHEGTGVVLKAGSKVDHVKEGGRVMIQFVPRDLPDGMTTANRTKYTWQGEEYESGVYTWAEHALLNEQMVVPLPDDVPTDVTAIIGCAVITGAGAALYTAEVRPGQAVAVFGVGGVGANVVVGAKIAGADPIIAVDLEEGKLGYAKELGATHTVNGSEVHAPDVVKELTDGGVDYAFDAIGVEGRLPAVSGERQGGRVGREPRWDGGDRRDRSGRPTAAATVSVRRARDHRLDGWLGSAGPRDAELRRLVQGGQAPPRQARVDSVRQPRQDQRGCARP